MGIVTKTGDGGTTSLYGGRRVSKDDIRVCAYGTVDELSSATGMLASFCTEPSDISTLTSIQRDLFTIAGYLSMESDLPATRRKCRLSEERLQWLEGQIDGMEKALPELKCFILPGGCKASSVSHLCRSVCRRAERCIVSLHNAENIEDDATVLKYVNRLSDFFFLLARKLNEDASVAENRL